MESCECRCDLFVVSRQASEAGYPGETALDHPEARQRHRSAFGSQKGEDRAQYGREVIRERVPGLTAEFGSGFSASTLKCMRQLYMPYPGRVSKIGQTSFGQFWHSQFRRGCDESSPQRRSSASHRSGYAAAIVACGDSSTDEAVSTENANHRCPDCLSSRLQRNPAVAQRAVLDESTWNRWAYDGNP